MLLRERPRRMHCLQVECWAETKLVKRSKWLEPRERREGGEDAE